VLQKAILSALYKSKDGDEEDGSKVDFSAYDKLTSKSAFKLKLAPQILAVEPQVKRRRPGSLPAMPENQCVIDFFD
jgi:hypothetical protein